MPSRIVAISARYQVAGTVTAIVEGLVVSEVEVETPAGRVISAVPTRSLLNLEIQVGAEVVATFISNDALLEKASPRRLEDTQPKPVLLAQG